MSTVATVTMLDRAMLSQLLALGAIHLGSQRLLRERIVNRTLTPPEPTTEEDKSKDTTKPESPTTTPGRTPLHRRILSKKTGVALLTIACVVSVEFFLVYVLPRISSALVLDALWASMCGWLLSAPISSALLILFGGPLTTQLVRTSNNKLSLKRAALNPEAPPRMYNTRLRTPVSCLLAAGVVGLTYLDRRNYVIPFASAMWCIHMYTSIIIGKLNTKGMTKLTVGFVTACMVLIPTIIAAGQFFSSKSGDKTPDSTSSSKVATPHDWVLTLMMLPSDLIIAVPVAFLISLTQRYDYFHSSSPTLSNSNPTAPGEIVPIPQVVPHRPTALYKLAMASLAASYLISDLVIYHLFSIKVLSAPRGNTQDEMIMSAKLMSFAMVNLLVPGVIALGAWWRGELTAWWGYSEVWIPQEEDESSKHEQSDINDAEKALLGPDDESSLSAAFPVDEKKALPVPA